MIKIHYSFLSLGNGLADDGEIRGGERREQPLRRQLKMTYQKKYHKVVRYIISIGRGRNTHNH
jgi:hypothetical protein